MCVRSVLAVSSASLSRPSLTDLRCATLSFDSRSEPYEVISFSAASILDAREHAAATPLLSTAVEGTDGPLAVPRQPHHPSDGWVLWHGLPASQPLGIGAAGAPTSLGSTTPSIIGDHYFCYGCVDCVPWEGIDNSQFSVVPTPNGPGIFSEYAPYSTLDTAQVQLYGRWVPFIFVSFSPEYTSALVYPYSILHVEVRYHGAYWIVFRVKYETGYQTSESESYSGRILLPLHLHSSTGGVASSRVQLLFFCVLAGRILPIARASMDGSIESERKLKRLCDFLYYKALNCIALHMNVVGV